MKHTIEEIGGLTFHIFAHYKIDRDLLLEAKTKGTPLVGTYSANKYKPHKPTGEYHLHVYDGSNEIFSINQSGIRHDGNHGVRIPSKVFQALMTKYPKWRFPKNQIIESLDYTTGFDFRGQFLRPVSVFSFRSDLTAVIESFDGFF